METCDLPNLLRLNEKRMNVYEKQEKEKRRRKENLKQQTIYYILAYDLLSVSICVILAFDKNYMKRLDLFSKAGPARKHYWMFIFA